MIVRLTKVVIAFMLLFLVVFYRGIYVAPPSKLHDVRSIETSFLKTSEFVDVHKMGKGTVVIDQSHENNFIKEELDVLVSRIISRGYSIKYFENGDLKDELKNASSFVVVLPGKAFTDKEIERVKDFVNGGGKLMMIADSGRSNEINSLALEFGILFWHDYLYNLKENDGNFKHIFLTNFTNTSLTKNLTKVVFYAAGSIHPRESGIIFSSNNTASSTTERKDSYTVAVLPENKKILAISDLTFMVEPYTVLDNNQFISNIADFLTYG